MKPQHLVLALAVISLLGCEQPPTTPADGAGTPATGARPPRQQPTFQPPTAPAAQDVLAVAVALKPEVGGATMADLDRDEDANDDFEPEIPVVFSVPGYGEGVQEANAELRVRGHSTRYASQKSYTLKLKKDQPLFRESRHVYLNKHPYDLSRVRNKLSFDLFGGLQHLKTLKTQFAQLTIDGQDYGLFTQIQRPDERYLAAVGLDPKGHLYKAEQFEFHRYADKLKRTSDAGYDEKSFESVLEIEGDNTDHGPLLAMLDAVSDESVPIDQTIDTHFDRDNYLTWLAVNVLLGNMDTNSQNFLLYAPSGGGKWQFLPWDYDGAWDFWGQPEQKSSPDSPGRWQEGLANWWGVQLHRRFLQVPANRAELDARIAHLASQYFTPERIRLHLDSYKDTVKPFVSRDPDLARLPAGGGGEVAAWEAEMARLPGVIQANLQRYHTSLERPMPIFLGEPRAEGGGTRFGWDESFDLQGDALTYEFQLSRSPEFTELVVHRPSLTETQTVVTEALPAGEYFWRVIISDAKNPTEHWQTPFDSEYMNDRAYRGMRRVTLPVQ